MKKTEDVAGAYGSGLVLSVGGGPGRRRRRIAFLAVMVLVAIALTWPVYPLFSRAFPLILGLPLSLAWVVAAILTSFGALLWLFRGDEGDEPKRGEGG